MMAHGTTGTMIPIMCAATSKAKVIRLGYDVRWFDYAIGHQVSLEDIEQILRFFQEMF
jgi:predicted esterase